MKALQVAQFGPPDVLRVVDIDEPHAGPGQIRAERQLFRPRFGGSF